MSETSRAGAESERYLRPTYFVDSDHTRVQETAQTAVAGLPKSGVAARAMALFYAVRDDVIYDPYSIGFDRAAFKASSVLEAGRGFCVNKAVLLCALGRAVGIPTRLGFADVKNHLASPRLLASMRTDVFAFHGYNELFIDGRWVKVTAAFDRDLCARFEVAPLDFDGHHDALLQPFNDKGRPYMQYVKDYGHFDDLPLEKMLAAFRQHYPHMFGAGRDG